MEKHRKIIIGLLLAVIFMGGVGVLAAYPELNGVCNTTPGPANICNAGNKVGLMKTLHICSALNYGDEPVGTCHYRADQSWGGPLILISLSLGVVLLILLFLPKQIFSLWWKFAIILLPILTFFIIITPVQCRAPLGICLDKEMVSLGAVVVFLLISLIVIIYKSLRLYFERKNT